ncbi:MAG: hypothetical protein OEW75_05870 [Cyclobacteriaceae bacterium]|nr:hypothetical protein [Cyclobacteriaceae bacterium]
MGLVSRITRRIKLEKKLMLLFLFRKFKFFKPENSILIFSDPRGGSTWLAELLECIPNSFIFWEPFAEIYKKPLKSLHFGWRQHIPQGMVWLKAKKVINSILSVSFFTEFTSLKLTPVLLWKGKTPIIKICRGNDFLIWLTDQYNFKYKPLYIIRHPFAVVASQLKQGGWDYKFNKFEVPKMPFNNKYIEHQEFLFSLESKEEQLCAVWCITNKENVSCVSGKFILITYEQLFLEPQLIISSIFKDWGITVPNQINSRISAKSSTTIDFMEGDSKEKQLSKWNTYFSIDQIQRLQKVLDYFNVDFYNSKTYVSESLWIKKAI